MDLGEVAIGIIGVGGHLGGVEHRHRSARQVIRRSGRRVPLGRIGSVTNRIIGVGVSDSRASGGLLPGQTIVVVVSKGLHEPLEVSDRLSISDGIVSVCGSDDVGKGAQSHLTNRIISSLLAHAMRQSIAHLPPGINEGIETGVLGL